MSAPAGVAWGSTFRVNTPDAVARVVLVAPGSTTHANDMNQRHVELSFIPAEGGVQAIAPPGANVAPPGPYMLFLLNAAGVPSVARFVQVGATGSPGPPVQPGGGTATTPGGNSASGRGRRAAPKVIFSTMRPASGEGPTGRCSPSPSPRRGTRR